MPQAFTIVIKSDSKIAPAHAYHLCKELIGMQQSINCVFLLGPSLDILRQDQALQPDEVDLLKLWQQFATQNKLNIVACKGSLATRAIIAPSWVTPGSVAILFTHIDTNTKMVYL